VNDEAESKEAQELFEQLGFKWAGVYPENGGWYSHLYAEKSTCCHLPIYVWNGLGDKFQELTLPQLRDLVAQSKFKQQGLISGADALRALADGKDVEYWCENDPSIQKRWTPIKALNEYRLSYFLENKPRFEFRLKPRTITLSLEIPAPFEPKLGETYYFITTSNSQGFDFTEFDDSDGDKLYMQLGAYRSASDVSKAFEALRGGIKA